MKAINTSPYSNLYLYIRPSARFKTRTCGCPLESLKCDSIDFIFVFHSLFISSFVVSREWFGTYPNLCKSEKIIGHHCCKKILDYVRFIEMSAL